MGLGTSECGVCPLGFGDAETPTAPPVPTVWCRFIGADGRYTIDSRSGNFARMPLLKQRIVWAISTALGSSTVQPAEGLAMPKKMGTTFAADMEARIRKALRRLTDVERLMQIESVAVERDTMRSLSTIRYVDLTSGQSDEITVEPRGA